MTAKEKAAALLTEWKGENYIFGLDVMERIGELTLKFGKRVLLISSRNHPKENETAIRSIQEQGGEVILGTFVRGARPNAPREDVYRMEAYILQHRPDVVVAIGGGSTLDAVKGSITLAVLGGEASQEVDTYFGVGQVTAALEKTGKKLIPYVAVETSASSGAHLTKYANITDPAANQKKLFVDMAVVPQAALFDYTSTVSMPLSVTIDGALDGIAHTIEAYFGAKPETKDKLKEICETAVELIVSNAKKLMENPADLDAREAVGLATDLGGYAIMVGGTSGAHLTSFSLVDLCSHGTACGIMNPYFMIFYAPAIQDQLLVVGNVLKKNGYLTDDLEALSGRDRAAAVSNGFIRFGKSIGAPTSLSDLPGFSEIHVERIIGAAKDPQLESKLQNMPVAMTSADVDEYFAPVIRAAYTGDISLIINK